MLYIIYILITLLVGLYLVGMYVAYGTIQAIQLNYVQMRGKVVPAHPKMLWASWYGVYWNRKALREQKKLMSDSHQYFSWAPTWYSLLWVGDMVKEITIEHLTTQAGASQLMDDVAHATMADLLAKIRESRGEDSNIVFGSINPDGSVEVHSGGDVEAIQDLLKKAFGEDVEITHVKIPTQETADQPEDTDAPRKWSDYEA